MGQVVHHPLQDWAKLDSYRPPDPRDPFYFARIEEALAGAADRYAVVTCHFNLIERLHMLHGFAETLVDFQLEPVKIEKLLQTDPGVQDRDSRGVASPLRRSGAGPVFHRRLGHAARHVHQPQDVRGLLSAALPNW